VVEAAKTHAPQRQSTRPLAHKNPRAPGLPLCRRDPAAQRPRRPHSPNVDKWLQCASGGGGPTFELPGRQKTNCRFWIEAPPSAPRASTAATPAYTTTRGHQPPKPTQPERGRARASPAFTPHRRHRPLIRPSPVYFRKPARCTSMHSPLPSGPSAPHTSRSPSAKGLFFLSRPPGCFPPHPPPRALVGVERDPGCWRLAPAIRSHQQPKDTNALTGGCSMNAERPSPSARLARLIAAGGGRAGPWCEARFLCVFAGRGSKVAAPRLHVATCYAAGHAPATARRSAPAKKAPAPTALCPRDQTLPHTRRWRLFFFFFSPVCLKRGGDR